MSATTPAPDATALTWATAPDEFRRSTYIGLGARGLMPLALTATLAWTFTATTEKLAAIIALASMLAMSVGVIGAAWKYRRAEAMVLPSEHAVKIPRRLVVATQVMSGLGEVGFVAILLGNHQPFAIEYATLMCCFGTSGLWATLYEKGTNGHTWSALARTSATLAVIALLAPGNFVATLIWAAGVIVFCNAALFCGGVLDKTFDEGSARPWAAKAYGAISRRRAKA